MNPKVKAALAKWTRSREAHDVAQRKCALAACLFVKGQMGLEELKGYVETMEKAFMESEQSNRDYRASYAPRETAS